MCYLSQNNFWSGQKKNLKFRIFKEASMLLGFYSRMRTFLNYKTNIWRGMAEQCKHEVRLAQVPYTENEILHVINTHNITEDTVIPTLHLSRLTFILVHHSSQLLKTIHTPIHKQILRYLGQTARKLLSYKVYENRRKHKLQRFMVNRFLY